MNELEVTWARATRIWWSLAWRGLLFGMIAGAAAGLVIAMILHAIGKSELAEVAAQIAGMVVGIPVGIWVVKTVLTKEFRHYRIALVPSEEATLETAVKSTTA